LLTELEDSSGDCLFGKISATLFRISNSSLVVNWAGGFPRLPVGRSVREPCSVSGKIELSCKGSRDFLCRYLSGESCSESGGYSWLVTELQGF
jgi:hypothetical protein